MTIYIGSISFLAALIIIFLPLEVSFSNDTLLNSEAIVSKKYTNDFPYKPIFRILLRVHLGHSSYSAQYFKPILNEINSIWLSQAGICFEIHTVKYDDELDNGFDLWFADNLDGWNGYFYDENDMWVINYPDLDPASHPAKYNAARTAAHELGHALNLSHRIDSDNNLMQSKTQGLYLNEEEIRISRKSAVKVALKDLTPLHCSPPKIHTEH